VNERDESLIHLPKDEIESAAEIDVLQLPGVVAELFVRGIHSVKPHG
jgi:hypothetical protein